MQGLRCSHILKSKINVNIFSAFLDFLHSCLFIRKNVGFPLLFVLCFLRWFKLVSVPGIPSIFIKCRYTLFLRNCVIECLIKNKRDCF